MTHELLKLCNHRIDDDSKTLSMRREFPMLTSLGRSKLLIPLQESLTANLPPASSTSENTTHAPFPSAAPTFEGTPSPFSRCVDFADCYVVDFSDEIEIMRSLAKPRKITIRGSNGQTYMFLGKPKDDLRKDARLMDFNAIINKLLKANSESRRRQLRTRRDFLAFEVGFDLFDDTDIRTYGVVTLNEECGFIQWVPNTIPIRPVLTQYYEARRIKNWVSVEPPFPKWIADDLDKTAEMNDVFRKIKDVTDKEAGELFVKKILPVYVASLSFLWNNRRV